MEEDRLNAIAHVVRLWNLSGTCSISFIALMYLARAELQHSHVQSCSNNDINAGEILCLDKMQSGGQWLLTRLQLNIHALISACRADIHTCICIYSWHRIERKEKLQLNHTSVTYSRIANVSIFLSLSLPSFDITKKNREREYVIIILRWCMWI